MITIAGKPLSAEEAARLSTGPIEKTVVNIMMSSSSTYRYDSADQLKFELQFRREIVAMSRAQNNSGLDFAIFRKSRCNPDYWLRTPDGGFRMKSGVRASDAIRDIFKNGSEYATECATALLIVYYGALLNIYPEDLYNRTFRSIYLMNWHRIDPLLQSVGSMYRSNDYFPGDRRYFANPDVNPLTPEWQGENTFDLSGGLFYGHGIGITTADKIIYELNQNRAPNADDSARLLDSAGRPDFDNLYDIYRRSAAA